MIVRWSLFTLWMIFNILDTVISWLAIQHGATEVGILYQVSSSWKVMVINKMLLATGIGLALVYCKKDSWLALLNLGMIGLVVYGGWVLLG